MAITKKTTSGKQNNLYDTYNRFQYYTIIYDEVVSDFRIGLGYNNLPSYPEGPEDTYYVIEKYLAGRPDLISLKFYGTTKLWWVIAKENNIEHPVRDLDSGITVRIPDAFRVLGSSGA